MKNVFKNVMFTAVMLSAGSAAAMNFQRAGALLEQSTVVVVPDKIADFTAALKVVAKHPKKTEAAKVLMALLASVCTQEAAANSDANAFALVCAARAEFKDDMLEIIYDAEETMVSFRKVVDTHALSLLGERRVATVEAERVALSRAMDEQSILVASKRAEALQLRANIKKYQDLIVREHARMSALVEQSVSSVVSEEQGRMADMRRAQAEQADVIEVTVSRVENLTQQDAVLKATVESLVKQKNAKRGKMA